MVEFETDNRDTRTTWLRIKNPSDLSDNAYIEVDPVDLMINMIENCSPTPELAEQLTKMVNSIQTTLDAAILES